VKLRDLTPREADVALGGGVLRDHPGHEIWTDEEALP
jgi:hypothetical protein